MKKLLIASTLALGLSAMAQPGDDHSMKTDRRMQKDAQSVIIKKEQDDQIDGKHVTYSGVAVQAIKARNPLQLVNPAAGNKYGAPENNVVRERGTERVLGLKFLGFQF